VLRDPDVLGSVGQVMPFGRDEDTKPLVANGFDEFIDEYVSAFCNGQ
jgi:cell wall assembly regulator SMI1